MADNRTGLSPADIAKSFRDRCGDGSVEWVTGPTHVWVLLDAADMLDEIDSLRNEFRKMDEWHSKELLAAVDNNVKLRELVRDMWRGCPADERDCIACEFEQDGTCDLFDRMESLGVDA